MRVNLNHARLFSSNSACYRDRDLMSLTGDLGIDWGGQGEDFKGERMGGQPAEANLFRYA